MPTFGVFTRKLMRPTYLIALVALTSSVLAQAPTSASPFERWKPLGVDKLIPLLDLTRAQAHKLREIDHHYQDAERILQEGADRTAPEELKDKHHALVERGVEEVRAVLDSTQFDRWWIVHQQQRVPRQPVP